MWYIIAQLWFVAINIWMGFYHSKLIAQHKTIRYPLWAAVYCVLIAPTFFLNWMLPVIGLVLRLPIFNTILNLKRNKPFFYVGKASVIDRLIRKYYPYVFAFCIIAIIAFNTILFL